MTDDERRALLDPLMTAVEDYTFTSGSDGAAAAVEQAAIQFAIAVLADACAYSTDGESPQCHPEQITRGEACRACVQWAGWRAYLEDQ